MLDNPLLTEPLAAEHVKPRLLGHWGTTPGLNLIYAHLNRVIRDRDANVIYRHRTRPRRPRTGGQRVSGGHLQRGIHRYRRGRRRDAKAVPPVLFSRWNPQPCAAQTPGRSTKAANSAIRWSTPTAQHSTTRTWWSHACRRRRGRNRAVAAGWHSNKFLDPVGDGAVLPILHLNGYKIANPTCWPESADELESLLRGYGYRPITVAGDEPGIVHQQLAAAFDDAFDDIAAIQQRRASGGVAERPRVADDRAAHARKVGPVRNWSTASRWRAPGAHTRFRSPRRGTIRSTGRNSKNGCAATSPRNCSTSNGALRAELAHSRPRGDRRMSANPHANGGLLLRDLDMPDFRDYAVAVAQPATETHEATRVLGTFLRDVIARNPRRFPPDGSRRDRLEPPATRFTSRPQSWYVGNVPDDENLAPIGRVMEVLSEHLCQGWLEGYLLTGRHGLFNCYEAFVHIVDSMFNQHAKWLSTSRELAWRRPIASLKYLLSSHVWRQDHNGCRHQDPGFIDLVANKRAEVVRVYLPPDANTLLSVADHCLRSRNYVNVIVAGKQPALS